MRERKAVKVVGRNQFASLFRALNISSALVRNKKLLFTHGANVNFDLGEFHAFYIESTSSTPIVSRARGKRKK